MTDPRHQGFDWLLKGLGGVFRQFSELSETLKESAGERGEKPVVEQRVSIRTVDGEEIDSSFFGVSPRQEATAKAATELELRNVPVEMMEQEETLTALAEMPGAAAETLDLLVEGDMLTMRAKSASVEFHAEAMLPTPIEPDSLKVTLRNGVVEATWRRVPADRAKS